MYLRHFFQRNATYANVRSPNSGVLENSSKEPNHAETNGSGPVTPVTPASNCPLLGATENWGPLPENPYSSLGELTPSDLISFAYQIAKGMVSSRNGTSLH